MDGDPPRKRYLLLVEVAAIAILALWSILDRPARWLLANL